MKRALKVISLVVLPVIILLAGWWLLSAKITSKINMSAQKTNAAEASKILGFAVPVPDYLPDNYEIKEVYAGASSVVFLISDGDLRKKLVTRISNNKTSQEYEVRCSMEIAVTWVSQGIAGGMKLPGEKPKIIFTQGQGYALIIRKVSYDTLWFHWRPNVNEAGTYSITITANKHVSKGELVKVAESMRLIK